MGIFAETVLKHASPIEREDLEGVSMVRMALSAAHKFVVTPEAVQEADALEWDDKLLQYLFLPYKNTWVEYTVNPIAGMQAGVVFIPYEDETAGSAIICATRRPRQHERQQCRMVTVKFNLRERPLFTMKRDRLWEEGYPSVAEFGDHVAKLLAFINSPRIVSIRDSGFAAINRKRVKKGREPFMEFKTVRLQPHVLALRGLPVDAGPGPHRRRHAVRAHLRLKLGRVELVRAHMRGAEELGIIHKDYEVR